MEIDSRPRLPALTYLVIPHLALACVIAVRPPLFVRLAVLSCLALVVLHGTTAFTMGDSHEDYRMGCVLTGFILNASMLLCLANPVQDYRPESSPDESLADLPPHQRIYSALCIIFNPRGVGWNWQVISCSSMNLIRTHCPAT